MQVGKVFAAGIDQFDDGFDVIVVDAATNRHNCARHARVCGCRRTRPLSDRSKSAFSFMLYFKVIASL